MRAVLLAGTLVLVVSGMARATGYQDFNLGIAAANRDDEDIAVQALTRAIATPDLPEHLRATAFLARGEAYADSNRLDAAIADYSAALKLKPAEVRTYLDRALAYYGEDKYEQALADDDTAIRLRPYYYSAHLQRMAVYSALRRYADELTDCDTLMTLYPGDKATILTLRSKAYIALGDYERAVSAADNAIDSSSKLVQAHLARATANALNDALEPSLHDFAEAIDLDADNVDAWLGKSFVQWDLGKFDESLEGFKHVLRLSSRAAYAVLGIEISSLKSGSHSADELPTEATNIDHRSWPGPIVDFYLGKMTESQLRIAVSNADPAFVAAQSCEVNFYVGEWRLAHGDAAGGTTLLRDATAICPPGVMEREAAKAELRRATVAERSK